MIDDLLTALERALEAKHDLLKCYDECAYEAGYFCASRQDAYARAQIEVAIMLDRIITERIAAYHGQAPARDWPLE